MSSLDRRRLERLLSSRFSRRIQSRDVDVLPHLRWSESVEWGLGCLRRNLDRNVNSAGLPSLPSLLNWTGRSTRALLTSRLASERGMVMHITLSPGWAKRRYLDLMRRSETKFPGPGPGPGPASYSSHSNTRFRTMMQVSMRQVEPLWEHGPPPMGDVLFTSLVGATCVENDLRGLNFSELVIDHLALDVIHKNMTLWKLNKHSHLPQFYQRYEQPVQEDRMKDSLGRDWALGMPFLVPGMPGVGLISDTISLFGITIGLVALYDGATVSLCSAACDLLVPAD